MMIDRTLFWFDDKSGDLIDYHKQFFPLGILLNRLLNEVYNGREIKFINIYFSTQEVCDTFPNIPKNEAYYYGGNLKFHGYFDFNDFNNQSEQSQKRFIWDNTLKYLEISAKSIKTQTYLQQLIMLIKKV